MPRLARPVLLAALLVSTAVAQDDPLFESLHIEMEQFLGPRIAAGDLDLDGRTDLVVEQFGSLRPLAGRGDGSFVLDERLDLPGLSQGSPTEDLVIADIDGDGIPDVLASGGPTIDVLTGEGDLTFSPGFGAIASTASTWQLAALDLDGDGDIDVAAGNHEGVRITVHLNGGGGAFLPDTEYGPIPQGFVTAAGDWDLDGDPDLVFGEFDADGLDLLFNDGTGHFGAPVPIVIPAPVASVAAGDLDADGDSDLVACTGLVRVLEGNGHGGFTPGPTLPQGFGASSSAVADMDEDGHADILVSVGGVTVYSGHGELGFGAGFVVPAGVLTTEFVLGDFDRDGEQDLAATNFPFDGVTIALGRDGNAWFPSAATSGPSRRVALADFDHDGRQDLVSANGSTTQGGCRLTVSRGVPQGAFEPAADLPAGSAPVAPAGVWAGPLDDDGDPDIVFAPNGFFGGTLQVRLGDGALGFSAPIVTAAGNDLRGLDAADFDVDGHMDLVTCSNALSEDYVLFGHGDGTFATPLVIDAWLSPNGVVTGDWNADGLPDFATVHSVSADSVQIQLKAAGPGFLPAQGVPTNLVTEGIAAGDADLDGSLDLVAGGDFLAAGGVVFLNDGNAHFTAQSPLGVGSGPVAWAIGDLDNDGLPDLLAAQKHSFENKGGVAFLPGLGRGQFGAAQEFTLPANTWDVKLADLDLDGVLDAVAAIGDAWAATALLSRRGPWDDVQHPLAGAHGYASQTTEGTLQGGAPFAFRLADAPPLAAVFHVVGLTELDAPFKGGVLVPSLDLLNGPLPVKADGTLELAGAWLSGLPSGLQLYFQFWWPDAGGPKGFAASRAIRATLP